MRMDLESEGTDLQNRAHGFGIRGNVDFCYVTPGGLRLNGFQVTENEWESTQINYILEYTQGKTMTQLGLPNWDFQRKS
jgi:ADP-dependent phosphofructokinase/glucokinase